MKLDIVAILRAFFLFLNQTVSTAHDVVLLGGTVHDVLACRDKTGGKKLIPLMNGGA